MPLSSGERLGPYEIRNLLGKGGMGEVYRAHDSRLGRDVAIKVSAEQFSERFEREARAVASLNHPNICQLYDIGPNYLVMELVEGETLTERIAARAIPLAEAIHISRQIVDALEAAHEKGIVHRDLKPANIKVTPDGVVKVLDFGLAKIMDPSKSPPGSMAFDESTLPLEAVTRVGVILGTAAYMAPEQARGEAVDKRSDIWSFGVVFYELVTGKRLFQGRTISDTLAAVLTAEPDWGKVPVKAQPLLRLCLVKDPKRRLRDIGDARILFEDGTSVAHAALVPAQGVSWKAAAAACAIVALVLSGILWRATRPVDRPLMRLSVDLGPDTGANPTTAMISPDGTRLVFSVNGPDGKQRLATRLLDQAQTAILPGTENGHHPFFSPDGQWVAFFASGQLKKISLQGGAPTVICEAPSPRGGSWGDDDYIVAALSGFGGLSRVSAKGGPPQLITQLGAEEVTHRWPQVLPGSQTVLFTASTNLDAFDNANLDLLTLKDGKRETVQRSGYFGRFLPTHAAAGHLVFLRQGVLWAVPFDPANPAVQTAPVPVLEDVAADVTSGDVRADFSRTGTFVYQDGRASPEGWPVLWLDRSGKFEAVIKDPSHYYTPRVAPDGQRLALSENAGRGLDLFVYDWRRDKKTPLTFSGQDNINPVWAPDGKHIAFRTRSGATGLIEWVRADGVGQPQRLLESKGTIEPYSFSPDGKNLAYEEFLPGSGFDIWILPLDMSEPDHPKPGKPEPFLRTPANEQDASFSPDGRWIAYRSNDSGTPEIYVQLFPIREGGGKWKISSSGGEHPRWSRNSKELLFLNLQQRIMMVDYTSTGDSFESGKPHPWSEKQDLGLSDSNFDLAPDGTHFVVFPRASAQSEQPKGSGHVTFLLNFFDELRKRAAPK